MVEDITMDILMDDRSSTNPDNIKHLLEIIEDYPKELSELLNTYGFDAEEILGEIFEYEDEFCSYNESYGVDSIRLLSTFNVRDYDNLSHPIDITLSITI